MGTTTERDLDVTSTPDLFTMTTSTPVPVVTTTPLLHSPIVTMTTLLTTTVHATTAMTTMRRMTTTTTTLATGEEMTATPLISAAAVAVCLGIIVVSCAAVMFVKFVYRSRRQPSCRAACLDFVTCTCLREVCCGTEDDGAGGESDVGGDYHSNHDMWEPPRYDDALGMQRLDSTTIHGTPPPQYKSLRVKTPPVEGLEGSVNLAFEYPYSFSRQVSCDRVSDASFFSVFDLPRTTSHTSQQQADLTLSPESLLRGQALCSAENHQRLSTSQNQSSDNQHTNRSEESETDNATSTLHNHETMSTAEPAVSGNVPGNFGWSLGGEQLEHMPDSGRQDQIAGVHERLPSYEEVLSWTNGTKM